MGADQVTEFLTHLAVKRQVAASTQNQALAALLFLYKNVLKEELPWLKNVERAKRPARIPLVLTRAEVKRLLSQLGHQNWLQASLLYGAGLRLREFLSLRVKDLDFEYQQIAVRDAKGNKDRVTMLPASAADALKTHLLMPKGCTCETLRMGLAESICHLRWRENTRTQIVNGVGNTSFPPRPEAGILFRARLDDTTSESGSCKKLLRMLCEQHKLTSPRVATLFVTVLPPTCSKTAMTFVLFKSC